MKVCVIGSNGRMGSFRTKLLEKCGVEVIGVDIGVNDDSKTDGIDGFVIATPLSTHKDLVLHLAGLGKPIFIEKPMAGTVSDITEMFDVCEQYNTPLYTGWQRRMNTNFQSMKYDLEQQKNDWRQIKIVSYDNPTPPPHVLDIPNYIYSDYAGHDLNEVLWLTNNEMPESIQVFESSLKYKDKIDNSLIVMSYSNGRRVVIDAGVANPNNYYGQELEIFTPSIVLKSDNTKPRYSFPEHYNQAFSSEIDLFINVCKGLDIFPEQYQQNINTAKLIQMCIDASVKVK